MVPGNPTLARKRKTYNVVVGSVHVAGSERIAAQTRLAVLLDGPVEPVAYDGGEEKRCED